ncbi:hypothetical protein K438DRAFT_1785925 [Mycena galopus ATCC 62051]|nr:hypothetical protein K438DRAFT_1785925 [Mycena galopus ATCC 62051]
MSQQNSPSDAVAHFERIPRPLSAPSVNVQFNSWMPANHLFSMALVFLKNPQVGTSTSNHNNRHVAHPCLFPELFIFGLTFRFNPHTYMGPVKNLPRQRKKVVRRSTTCAYKSVLKFSLLRPDFLEAGSVVLEEDFEDIAGPTGPQAESGNDE